MNPGWQDVVTIGLVLAAAVYLARGFLVRRPKAAGGGCATGGCGACPLNATATKGTGCGETISIS